MQENGMLSDPSSGAGLATGRVGAWERRSVDAWRRDAGSNQEGFSRRLRRFQEVRICEI